MLQTNSIFSFINDSLYFFSGQAAYTAIEQRMETRPLDFFMHTSDEVGKAKVCLIDCSHKPQATSH